VYRSGAKQDRIFPAGPLCRIIPGFSPVSPRFVVRGSKPSAIFIRNSKSMIVLRSDFSPACRHNYADKAEKTLLNMQSVKN